VYGRARQPMLGNTINFRRASGMLAMPATIEAAHCPSCLPLPYYKIVATFRISAVILKTLTPLALLSH